MTTIAGETTRESTRKHIVSMGQTKIKQPPILRLMVKLNVNVTVMSTSVVVSFYMAQNCVVCGVLVGNLWNKS